MRDLLYAFRTFRRAPAFALTAIVTFALDIGATTAMFSTVNAALLRPFPYPHAEDFYAISQRFTDGSLTSGLIAPVEFTALNQPGASVLRAAGVIRLETTFLRDDGTPMLAEVYAASEGFFDIFGLPMTLGHGFAPADHVLQGPGVMVMSYRVWRDVYGSDPQIVGRRVRFSDVTVIVIGVAARDFDVPHATDFWVNARIDPRNVGHGYRSYLRVTAPESPSRRACWRARAQHDDEDWPGRRGLAGLRGPPSARDRMAHAGLRSSSRFDRSRCAVRDTEPSRSRIWRCVNSWPCSQTGVQE